MEFHVQGKESSVLIMNVDVAYSEEIHVKGRHMVAPVMLFQALVRAEMVQHVKVWSQETIAIPTQVHAHVLRTRMKNVHRQQGIVVILKTINACVEISLPVSVNQLGSTVTRPIVNVNVLAMLMHVLFRNFAINMNFASVDVAIHA